MNALLRLLLGMHEQATTVYECRQCGTTVETEADACPYCGLTDIVEYELS